MKYGISRNYKSNKAAITMITLPSITTMRNYIFSGITTLLMLLNMNVEAQIKETDPEPPDLECIARVSATTINAGATGGVVQSVSATAPILLPMYPALLLQLRDL